MSIKTTKQPADRFVTMLLGALAAFFFPKAAVAIIGCIAMFRTWRRTNIAQPSINALRQLAERHQMNNIADALFPRQNPQAGAEEQGIRTGAYNEAPQDHSASVYS